MPGYVESTAPVTLSDYESLVTDKDVQRKTLIHTIRDYMPFFDQSVIVPGNNGDSDKGQIITKYPEGQLRGYNEGWDSEDVAGHGTRYVSSMVRTRSTVDLALYNTRKPGEREDWRLRKDQGFMRGLARSAVRRVFYGDASADPRDAMGLANIVVPENDAFANRIINAGGSTADKQTSIWLCNWRPDAFYLFYPQGGEGPGLSISASNEPTYVTDKNSKQYLALVTEFGWDIGVALYDPESVVRIANIDTTKLSKNRATSTSADLVDLMTQALEMLPDDTSGKLAFYMNDTVRSVLRRQINNTTNVNLTWGDVAGRNVLRFGDVPVHKLGSDVLKNTEAVLTF